MYCKMIVKYGEEISKGTVRADFISGANDLVKAEAFFPGWLNTLLTTCVHGLENSEEMLRHLDFDKEAIKVYVEVAQDAQEDQEVKSCKNSSEKNEGEYWDATSNKL
jgi:hypothetical protein